MRAAVALGAAAAAALGLAAGLHHAPNRYVVRPLVSDGGVRAARHDRTLVNAWGLAASPTGPWWTGNEAEDTSSVYSGEGRKQLLTVSVGGGPTGVAYYAGKLFRVAGGGRSDPARFVYACEDGRIRAWTPTVPTGWSTKSEIVVDLGAEAAVFRGIAILGSRLYATDFHNARVEVFDGRWRRLRLPFADPAIPAWYAPFGIAALGGHIFVTYVFRAPVNGNDAPTGGYVDEFDRDGRLVARVGRMGALNAPWGLALAPSSFARHGRDLLVGNFGDGRILAFNRSGGGWKRDGELRGRDGRPLQIRGLWGIAFGNGGLAGPTDTLFFASGPHTWRGATELGVHGLLGSIEPA